MTHDELKAKALAREDVRAEYEALAPEFALLGTMLQARKKAGMTQAQVAQRMGTKTAAVTRLESSLSNGKHSPSLVTLRRYAAAVDCQLEIRFVEA